MPIEPSVSVITALSRPELFKSRCAPSVCMQYGVLEHLAIADDDVTWQPNTTGIAEAKYNAGIARARGEYVAFLCDDNEYLPGHIWDALFALNGGDFDFCLTGVEFRIAGQCQFDVKPWNGIVLANLDGNGIVAKRELAQRIGWRVTGKHDTDYDLVLRWLQSGAKPCFVKRSTVIHHDGWLAGEGAVTLL